MKSRMLLVLALVAFVAALLSGYWGLRLSQSSTVAMGVAAGVDGDISTEAASAPSSSVSLASNSVQSSSGQEQATGAMQESLSLEERTTVVVLARNKAAYSTITADDLILEHLQIAPPGSFTELNAVVGQTLWRDMPAGSILSDASFNMGGPLSRMIREDERALAISVDEVVSNGGYLRPGDFVDVLLYLSQDDKNTDRTMQVVVPALRVLSVGARLGATLEGEPAEPPLVQDEDDNRRSVSRTDSGSARTAVLAVPSAILTRFALAAEVGQLRLAVRSAGEELLRRYLDDELQDDESIDYHNIEQQLYQFEKFALRNADSSQDGVVPPAPPGVEVFRGVSVSREQP